MSTDEKDYARVDGPCAADRSELLRPATGQSAHTSGPWEVEYVVDGAFSIHGRSEGDEVVIAHRNTIPHRHEEFTANARLIAAAPDLLAVAKYAARIHTCCCSRADASPCLKCQAETAIAKAEGQ